MHTLSIAGPRYWKEPPAKQKACELMTEVKKSQRLLMFLNLIFSQLTALAIACGKLHQTRKNHKNGPNKTDKP